MSAVYPDTLEQFLQAGVDMASLTIKIVLLDSGYVYSASHNFLNDISAGDRLGTPATLTNKTFTAGVFRADPVTISGVAALAVVTGLAGFADSGVEATSRLIWHDDQSADESPINFTADGAGIPVSWPNRCFSI